MVMLFLWQLTAGRGQSAKLIVSTSHEGDPILNGIISVSYEIGFRKTYYSEQREDSTLSSSFFLVLAEVQSGPSIALGIKHRQRLQQAERTRKRLMSCIVLFVAYRSQLS